MPSNRGDAEQRHEAMAAETLKGVPVRIEREDAANQRHGNHARGQQHIDYGAEIDEQEKCR